MLSSHWKLQEVGARGLRRRRKAARRRSAAGSAASSISPRGRDNAGPPGGDDLGFNGRGMPGVGRARAADPAGVAGRSQQPASLPNVGGGGGGVGNGSGGAEGGMRRAPNRNFRGPSVPPLPREPRSRCQPGCFE